MPTVSQAIEYDTFAFLEQSKGLLKSGKVFSLLNPIRIWQYVLNIFYVLVQSVIIWSFKPVRLLLVNFPHFIELLSPQKPPPSEKPLENPRGRIAVIGAGITGVSSAA